MAALSAEKLRSTLDYDPETGIFTHNGTSNHPRARKGMEAGTQCKTGYREIRVGGVIYSAHRLAWLYVYGSWPSTELDHANGVKNDNCIANLREATRSQNMANASRQKNSTSGVKGVSFDKRKSRWKAYITVSGKFINLGLHRSRAAAAAARASAGLKAFGDYART